MGLSLEEARERILQSIAEAYAHDECSEAEMEEFTRRAAQARSLGELAEIGKALPALLPQAHQELRPDLEGSQTLVARSGSVRRTGRWLQSQDLKVSCASSSLRLDLTEYRDLPGATVRFDLDLASCSLRVTLPPSFDVRDSISESVSSSLRLKLRPVDEAPRNVLELRGSIRSSSVRIKRKRK